MRFLRLDLKAVGPFTNTSIDLSTGAYGLHVIHGPNEAGKTSTLRALSYLLFGFPQRLPDDFLHPYAQLRVGALLRHSDGEELEIVRRKAIKDSLRGGDDASVVAPERLSRFLGGIDQEGFEALFGIDHARLARAGEEIRTGQGRLGELLFAAGTGLAGLRDVQKQLESRIDELFKPRGQNPRINLGLSELRTQQDEIKTLQLSSEDWQRHDRALREAREQAERVNAEINHLQKERNRLERIKSALPIIGKTRMLRGRRDELIGVVRLRSDFGKDSRAAQESLHLALMTIEQAGGALCSLEQQIEALEPPRDLLESADAIEALRERLGAEEKASHDRDRLETFRDDHAHLARQLLRDLGHADDLEGAGALRLRADEPLAIRELARKFTSRDARRDEILKAIGRLEGLVDRIDRKRGELGEPRAVEPLRRAVAAARKAGDLDDRHDQARDDCADAESSAARALASLPGWVRSLDDLERLAPPLEATIDRFEAAIQQADLDVKSRDETLRIATEEIGRLEASVQALDLQSDVPTEADLPRPDNSGTTPGSRSDRMCRAPVTVSRPRRSRAAARSATCSSNVRDRPIPWRTGSAGSRTGSRARPSGLPISTADAASGPNSTPIGPCRPSAWPRSSNSGGP